MSYAAAIEQLNRMTPELYSRPGQPRRKFSLDEIAVLLAALGDPQKQMRAVLIAGTNGKGSVAATLASILTASGLRAGLYTSPHLERVNERIRIGEEEIVDENFGRLFFHVQQTARQLEEAGKLPQPPSFFEVLTAVALIYFAEAKVDLAVLEVGMGGRLDATNVVDPLLSVITDISLDHTEWLGSTIAAIAREKAGILRRDGTLIALPQNDEVDRVLAEGAATLGARQIDATAYLSLHPDNLGSPSMLRSLRQGVKTTSPDITEKLPSGAKAHTLFTTSCDTAKAVPFQNVTFTTGCNGSHPNTTTPYTVQALGAEVEVASPLTGAHQQRNVALAIAAAVELATAHGLSVTPFSIAQGIRETRWPGRLERVRSGGVEWILDVAHNPAGALALRSGLASILCDERPRRLVFSCLRDKPLGEMAEILFPFFDELIFAPIHSARATAMDELEAAGRVSGKATHSAGSVGEALEWARKNAQGGTVVVSGSVYLVGEARSILLAGGERA